MKSAMGIAARLLAAAALVRLARTLVPRSDTRREDPRYADPRKPLAADTSAWAPVAPVPHGPRYTILQQALVLSGLAALFAGAAWALVPTRAPLGVVYPFDISHGLPSDTLNRAVVTVNNAGEAWSIEVEFGTKQMAAPPVGSGNRVWIHIRGGVQSVEDCTSLNDAGAVAQTTDCQYDLDESLGLQASLRPTWSRGICALTSAGAGTPCFIGVAKLAVVADGPSLLVADNGVDVKGVLPKMTGLPGESGVVIHLPIDPLYQINAGPLPNVSAQGYLTSWWLNAADLPRSIEVAGGNATARAQDSFRTFLAGVLAGVSGGALVAVAQVVLSRRRHAPFSVRQAP